MCITQLSFEDGVALQILRAPQRLETTHLAVLLILRVLIGAIAGQCQLLGKTCCRDVPCKTTRSEFRAVAQKLEIT